MVTAIFLAQQDTGWEEAKFPPAHMMEMSTNAFEGTVPASSVPEPSPGHTLWKDNGLSEEIWRKEVWVGISIKVARRLLQETPCRF